MTATFHCVIDRSTGVFRALGYLARWARRGVALNAVSSMAATRVSAAAGDAPVEVVPNGVDAAWWRPVTERAEAGTRHPVHVVSAMRLVSRKRPLATLSVLRGARAILDPSVGLRATIVGEGPQRPMMERYLRTRQTGLGHPARAGRQGGAAPAAPGCRRLPDHRTARGLRHRRRSRPGRPGCRCVAPRGTGVDDFVVDGVDGLLADSDVALAGALAHLAGDDALRARMRAHLLDTPPAQDWSGVLAATLAEYRRAGALVA